MTGAAPRFSAGHARRLAGGLGQVQFLVADQTYPTETQTPVARRRFGQPGRGVPVELDQSFAFSPPDHHFQALHRHEQFQRLDPLRRHAQRVIVAQVVELGAVFAFDGRRPAATRAGDRRPPFLRRGPQGRRGASETRSSGRRDRHVPASGRDRAAGAWRAGTVPARVATDHPAGDGAATRGALNPMPSPQRGAPRVRAGANHRRRRAPHAAASAPRRALPRYRG